MIMKKNKKSKSTRKYAIKQELKFQDYKDCLKANQLENNIKQPEKNKLPAIGPTESITNSQKTID